MKSRILRILAVILLITASCENNSEEIQNEIQQIEVQNGLELVTGNFDQFPELKDLYKNLIIKKRNASELNNKKYYFEIDSSNIVKSSFEGDVFFTIPIIGEINQTSFENLVLTLKKNGLKEAYIINYEPDNDYLKRVSTNPFAYFTGSTGSTNLNSLSSKSCYFITYTVCTWSGHPSNSGIPVGSGCEHVETVKIEVCSGEPTVTINGSGLYSPSSVGEGQTNILQGTDVITNPIYLKVINPHIYVLNELKIPFKSSEANWLKRSENFEFLLDILSFIEVNNTIEALDFVKYSISVKMAVPNSIVDFNKLFIETPTPDTKYIYQGAKTYISNPLTLRNGDKIKITFDQTKSDGKSSNQQVAIDLIEGIKYAVEAANKNLSGSDKILGLHIFCTTNGTHSATSNHGNGTAVDISRINGKKMIVTGVTNQIKELQKAMDNYQYVRENFGPFLKHKYSKESNSWNYNYPVKGHKDHIHFSIRK
ncbi:hypothetical protein [uncultured Maribacter sp.]|uniref:hypothetical protein n=1 Tax=uncultured Maribacter sp. TaxID=431308 RepID=UPI002620D4CF|nr:hypothetical protein [uncultured Maribacter sp.]